MRKTLTDKGVAALKPRASRYAYPDPELAGHYVRITPNGAKSFAAVTRDPDGKQIWTTLGATDRMTIATARELAREAITRVRAGLPAVEPKAETFGDVVGQLAHAPRRAQRPAVARRDRAAARSPYPSGVARPRIRRDPAQRHHRPARQGRGRPRRAAGRLLPQHRAQRHELVRRAARRLSTRRSCAACAGRSPHAQARARILTDDEIRAIWRAAETDGTFGALIRHCAADRATARKSPHHAVGRHFRRRASGRFRRSRARKIPAGCWCCRKSRVDIIQAQPRLGDNPYVFAGRGDGPFNGFGKSKARFDGKLPEGTAGWTVHDLRRTARSVDEPGRGVERARRARHGPRDCGRRGRL